MKLRISSSNNSDELDRRRVLWLREDGERCSCHVSRVNVPFASISVRIPRDQPSHSCLLCHLWTWHPQFPQLSTHNHPMFLFYLCCYYCYLSLLFECNIMFFLFVWFKVAEDAVVSWVLSFQAHPGAKADLNDGMWCKCSCEMDLISKFWFLIDPVQGFCCRTILWLSWVQNFTVSSRSKWSMEKVWNLMVLTFLLLMKDPDFFFFFLKVLIHNNSHLASTYCAIAILKIVGYDLSNLDSESIVTSMRNLQQPDGRYVLET